MFSLLGTFYQGYFFAFHMLNIMSTNALLGGVIKSVTQNGKLILFFFHLHPTPRVIVFKMRLIDVRYMPTRLSVLPCARQRFEASLG